MNMKKFTLRDEYTPISREELKAFADEINPQGESKRAKGADAEKARKTGKGFARAKIYNILDNGKFEGHIYDRTEEINISKEDDDIRMMEHAGRFDGFNGAGKHLTNDAPAYNKPTMIKFNGNAKPLDEINAEEIKSIMTDECISNGKWNGQLISQEKYDEIMNEETIIDFWRRTSLHQKTLTDDDGNKYTKTYKIAIREYDAGALAKILTKEYKGIPQYRDTKRGKEQIKPNKLMARRPKGCKHPKQYNNLKIELRNRHPQTQQRILNNYQIEIMNKYKHIYNPMRA